MKIVILCTDAGHPVNHMLFQWIDRHAADHDIELLRDRSDLIPGDLLILVSCSQILSVDDRKMFGKSLVIHASDLPRGRGWSPHVWEILEGATEITVSLLEVDDEVDRGDIWKKVRIDIPQHALHDEINNILFKAESELMNFALEAYGSVRPSPQESTSDHDSYYQKRTPADSKLDPAMSIESQFNLIRVSDPNRYPTFFSLYGHQYKLVLEKMDNE